MERSQLDVFAHGNLDDRLKLAIAPRPLIDSAKR